MAFNHPKILVIGAAGRFAGLVVPQLARQGVKVRGLVRDPKQGDTVRTNGASEIMIGDLRNRASLDAALKGVDGVFYIAPVFQADEVAMGLQMVEAAKKAAVKRFVFSSVIHPTIEALESHAAKRPVEEAIYASGMPYTVLNPTTFFQNIAAGWPAVEKADIFSEPFSKTARITRVDYRDVAEVAAEALIGDRLLYGTFELCASGSPNREDIVSIMSEVLGRAIKAGEPSFDAWAAKTPLPYDEHQKQLLAKMYDYYGKHSSLGNSLTLRAILGREPRSLKQFIEELAGKSGGT
jgi:uncharacterized protein YbjT (DUF2867 family)